METIPLNLNGYTDLPPGKIANVVTYLERAQPPARLEGRPPGDLMLRDVAEPSIAWFRDIYRRVGENWLWFSAATMSDAQLAAELNSDATAFIALERQGQTIGIAELHFGGEKNTEIVTFGVVPEATGTGAAGFLMEAVLARAFRPGISRVWLHTCSFDHPAAIRFYLKRGFRAYKFAIEVVDDPRLTGALPPTAAPHVPMIAQPGPARRD